MADRGDEVEWVESTVETVVIMECLPPDDNTVIPVLEAAETPVQTLLETVEREETTETDDVFYCDECIPLFQDQSDPAGISGPSFVLNFPTSLGVPQRALLSLPYGLMIGRSSIPAAGVGVMNHGPPVCPGMHFGPYEGDVTTGDEAMASDFAWEICKGEQEYEYIDAATESHSNWLRYINCARNKEETNLLAVQCRGSILYHCCRVIQPGDELTVWPSDKLLSNFSEAWTQTWLMKLNAAENNSNSAPEIFLCPHCQLTYTTESFLQRHTDCFPAQPAEGSVSPEAEIAENPYSNADPDPAVDSVVVLSIKAAASASSKTCEECGKIFKQIPHLRRHQLCVHSNKRPYCCAQCKRTFNQASGFKRHQLIHQKQAARRALEENVKREEGAACAGSEVAETGDDAVEEEGQAGNEDVSAGEPAEKRSRSSCSDCGKDFSTEASLRKHKSTVHENRRPYVCYKCQKCFSQYHDLNRHLLRHQIQKTKNGTDSPEEQTDAAAMPFGCAKCSHTFFSVDSLQQHVSQQHADDTVVEVEVDVDDDPGCDADFVPPPSLVKTVKSVVRHSSQRPQRPGARSRLSAITKLIAPKRRRDASSRTPVASAQNAESGKEDAESKKFKWFSCNNCKCTYTDADDLKTHRCDLKAHKCSHCEATFSKSGFLRRHEQTAHAVAKSYPCKRCSKAFPTPSKLKLHQKGNSCTKYHCASEMFPCTHCQFSFTMRSYLIKHVKRHHPLEYVAGGLEERLEDDDDEQQQQQEEDGEEKFFKCPKCGKRFLGIGALKCHACFQVKILYVCNDCGKSYPNQYTLKMHKRVHTGEKPYRCPHCDKSFSYHGQLNVHLRTHTGEKPYLCTHCGESFRQSGDLKRHERKHTGVRPHTCAECNKSFSRPQSLKAHEMLHQGQKKFKCAQCGKSFLRNYHLRRHHQKVHT